MSLHSSVLSVASQVAQGYISNSLASDFAIDHVFNSLSPGKCVKNPSTEIGLSLQLCLVHIPRNHTGMDAI